jgi:hypothetical protein
MQPKMKCGPWFVVFHDPAIGFSRFQTGLLMIAGLDVLNNKREWDSGIGH